MSSNKRLTFDKTNAVQTVGTLCIQNIIGSGGPAEYARLRREETKCSERKKYEAQCGIQKTDSGSKRKFQNRKSSKLTAEGRKAHMKAMEDIDVVVTLQVHSLKRVSDHLGTKIINAEKELHRIGTYRNRISQPNTTVKLNKNININL